MIGRLAIDAESIIGRGNWSLVDDPVSGAQPLVASWLLGDWVDDQTQCKVQRQEDHMTTEDNQDAETNPAADATESGEPSALSARETLKVVGEQLKPQGPIENLKSNTPMPGDSWFTKVMKIITS